MRHLVGIDVGTSGTKAVLIDERGLVLATATEEYPLSTPRPLWSEQNPDDWWRASRVALRTVVAQAGVPATSIVGIGLSGQQHGSVFLDSSGAVVRPALLWNDQRTGAECDEISRRVGAKRLLELTGNPAVTGFQAPKILWLRNHEPEHYARVAQVLLPKDYVRYKLSGVFASDANDASGTLLTDLRTRDWSSEILAALDIPRDWLPQIYEGPQITSELLPDVAHELGLVPGTPIVAGGGDNGAAAIGTGIIHPGTLSWSIGTSGVLFAYSEQPAIDPQARIHSFCHDVPGAYALLGVTLAAGGSLRWLRDTLRDAGLGTCNYDTLVALAQTVPAGAEGLLFLPYLTGERAPHLDPLARGALVGLTTRHTAAHIARAVLEGVAFSLRDSLELMRGLGLPISEAVAIGGGARSSLWREIQANIFGLPLVTLNVEEGPAYGAALLAGVGAQVFADVSAACETALRPVNRSEPDAATQHSYDELYAIYRGLYPALKGAMHGLAARDA